MMKLSLDAHHRFVSKPRKYIAPNKMRISFLFVIAAITIGLASSVVAISEEDNSAIVKPDVNLLSDSLDRPATRKLKKAKQSKGCPPPVPDGSVCFTEETYNEAQALISEYIAMQGDLGIQFFGCGWAITKGIPTCGASVVGCVLGCVATAGLACGACFVGSTVGCISAIEEIIEKC